MHKDIRLRGFDNVRHYHKIIKALVKTDRIISKFDEIIGDSI